MSEDVKFQTYVAVAVVVVVVVVVVTVAVRRLVSYLEVALLDQRLAPAHKLGPTLGEACGLRDVRHQLARRGDLGLEVGWAWGG